MLLHLLLHLLLFTAGQILQRISFWVDYSNAAATAVVAIAAAIARCGNSSNTKGVVNNGGGGCACACEWTHCVWKQQRSRSRRLDDLMDVGCEENGDEQKEDPIWL